VSLEGILFKAIVAANVTAMLAFLSAWDGTHIKLIFLMKICVLGHAVTVRFRDIIKVKSNNFKRRLL